MNKEQFWNIVDDVHNTKDPRNQREVLAALHERLRKLPADEIVEWYQTFNFYLDAADRNDLWAASAAMGAHCSDDGFIDFRAWLISQGHDVYMAALQDPESLADVNVDGQNLNFESYAYVAFDAYAERRAYDEMPLFNLIVKYDHWKEIYQWQAIGKRETTNDAARRFMRERLTPEYDITGISETHKMPAEARKDLAADIPHRPDLAITWGLEDLPVLFPRLYQKRTAALERIAAQARTIPETATHEWTIRNEQLRDFLGSLPCASQEELKLFRYRISSLSDSEETILSAMIQQYDPHTAGRVLELLEEANDYRILLGASDYAALGRYLLEHETSIPREHHEYMDAEALGYRYAQKYPGAFVGNDYVQYPTAEQSMTTEVGMEMGGII